MPLFRFEKSDTLGARNWFSIDVCGVLRAGGSVVDLGTLVFSVASTLKDEVL